MITLMNNVNIIRGHNIFKVKHFTKLLLIFAIEQTFLRDYRILILQQGVTGSVSFSDGAYLSHCACSYK